MNYILMILCFSNANESLVILGLNYLEYLAENPKILKLMLDSGIITILCSFFIHDPKFVKSNVLFACGNLLLRLQEDDQARDQMIRSLVLFTILLLVVI